MCIYSTVFQPELCVRDSVLCCLEEMHWRPGIFFSSAEILIRNPLYVASKARLQTVDMETVSDGANKHATDINEAQSPNLKGEKTRWWYHPPSWISMQGLSWVLKAIYEHEAPGHTVYRLPPITHTRKGPPYPPCSYDLPSLRYLFFGSAGYLPIQLPFRLLSIDHVPPEHYPFSFHSLSLALSFSLFPPWWCPWAPICAAVPVVLWIHYVLLTVLFLLYSLIPPARTHTHTHTHTHTTLRLLQSFALLQTLSVFWLRCLGAGWERERKKIMCMCVWVCECDLYLRVAGFLIRGQGPHCSDKDRDETEAYWSLYQRKLYPMRLITFS